MTEIRGAGGVKPKMKPSPGRDDGGKGEGVLGATPQPGRKKDGGVAGKGRAPDAKQKPVASVSKPEVQGKASVSTSTKTITKTTTKTTTAKARAVKKVYTLPGQKYDPPEEREPLRIFYESLSKQIPSSEMAELWMMEHGLLSPEKAKRAYEKKQRRQQQLRTGTPIKSTNVERPESSKTSQVLKSGDIKAKRRVNYSDYDDDFIVKHKKVN